MQSVRHLIRAANPVPEERNSGLSNRAEGELMALIATTPESLAGQRRPLQRKPGVQRRLAFAAAAAVVAVAATGAFLITEDGAEPPNTAAEPFYRDAQALEGSADIIVRATIGATRPEDRDGISEVVATAEVSASAKGEVTVGKTLEFAYMKPGSGPEAPTGLKVGGEYVLLLETRPGAPAFVVSSIQGYYTVTNDKLVPNKNNPVALSTGIKKKLGLG